MAETSPAMLLKREQKQCCACGGGDVRKGKETSRMFWLFVSKLQLRELGSEVKKAPQKTNSSTSSALLTWKTTDR